MVFSLLLQSQYGDSSSTTKDISNNCLENENEDENDCLSHRDTDRDTDTDTDHRWS